MSLSKMTAKYVGKTFESCSCMDLAYGWFTDLGVEVPVKYKDLGLHSYFEQWEQDRKGTLDIMLELFKTLGKHVDVDKIKKHDLLAVEEKGNIYAAIAIGSNSVITSHLTLGVKIRQLGKLHRVILARRLI